MFCKPGILIFIFAENNYLVRQYICPHHVDYNTFAPSELSSPCPSFFLSLSLSLYFWLISWNAKAGCVTQEILASLLLSLTHRRHWTTMFRSIKGPQHMISHETQPISVSRIWWTWSRYNLDSYLCCHWFGVDIWWYWAVMSAIVFGPVELWPCI